jgi:hypothetical protein
LTFSPETSVFVGVGAGAGAGVGTEAQPTKNNIVVKKRMECDFMMFSLKKFSFGYSFTKQRRTA